MASSSTYHWLDYTIVQSYTVYYPILRELERQAATEEDLCFQVGRAHSSEGGYNSIMFYEIDEYEAHNVHILHGWTVVGCYCS